MRRLHRRTPLPGLLAALALVACAVGTEGEKPTSDPADSSSASASSSSSSTGSVASAAATRAPELSEGSGSPAASTSTTWRGRARGLAEVPRGETGRPTRSPSRVRTSAFETWLREYIASGKPRSMHDRFVEGTDEVIRYESLADGFRDVLQKAGAPPFELPLVNPTKEKAGSYRDYYTPELRGMVEVVYAGDLDRFGYAF